MNLSPQAHRRFLRTMTDGEIRDMARDLADYCPTLTSTSPEVIYQALVHYQTDWNGGR